MSRKKSALLLSVATPAAPERDATPQQKTSPLTQALFSVPDARRYCGGLGNTRAYELMAEGRWQAVKLGARTFVTRASLDAFIAGLPAATITTGQNATA